MYRLYHFSALVVNCCPTCIVGRQSAPVAIHRNQRVETSVPSISYSTNEGQLATSLPTAPLDSPRDHQPYLESGYILPDILTKDDPPSYAEAISMPETKEICNKIGN